MKTQAEEIADSLVRDGIRWQNRHLHLIAPEDLVGMEQDEFGRAALAGELDIGQATIDELARDCRDAIIELRPGSEMLLRSTSVHLSFDDTVTASSFRCPDGSAAVLINSGLFGYVLHLASLAARLSTPRRGDRRYTDEPLGERRSDVRAAAATLRYHFVQERIWGLPGKLPVTGSAAGRLDGMSSVAAMSFAICHELAHLALGHSSDVDDSRARHQAELEADVLALEATRRTLLPAYRIAARRRSAHGAVMGAALISLALASVEFHLVLREGSSHPPASERWEALEAHQRTAGNGGASIRSVQALLRPLADALEFATMLAPLPDSWWDELPQVSWIRPEALDVDYLSLIRNLDSISLADPIPELLEPLRQATATGTDLDVLLDPRPADQLAALGVDTWASERILDAESSLSRSGLVASLANGTAISSVAEDGDGITAAVVAARFVEAALREQGLIR